jgi:hypothetical protein
MKAMLGANVKTNFRLAALLLCLGRVLLGCERQHTPVPSKPQSRLQMEPPPPTPIAEERKQLGESGWKPEWGNVVEEALPPWMLSKRAAGKVKGFCPQFGTMVQADKRAFWAYFFEALASAEAGLNPAAVVIP